MNAISPMDFSLVRQPTPLGAEHTGGDDQRAELREAAQAFEAVLLRQMLTSARSTDFGGESLFQGSDDTFTQMRDEQFADIASKSGQLGFAASIEKQLARFLPSGEGPEVKG